ncbi:quinon protein alcohol dehydrogenase-like superfamily [Apodospora peruviana]|uniref:Quinon protein alcohol dehydrogenase-like superfamily n=1 Tax=Apodospora peruviana TaxID=516989 RepID=A0AAE0I1L4_9PEZI|nr:quinon protein alcohol dehydrogenase-like superfamily [Apodospora peruviana]
MPRWNLVRLAATAALLLSSSVTAGGSPMRESPWLGWGGSSLNTRFASTNTKISSSNIANVRVHCQIPFKGGVSAAATILDGIAYFPAWNGSLVALDYTFCKIKWQINVTKLVNDFAPSTPIQDALIVPVSRTTPQIDPANKIIYFGTFRFAIVVAADLMTGKILAVKRIHTHPLAQITQSPSLHGDTLFIGTSSSEESIASLPADMSANYTCCSFVGSAVALRFSRKTAKFTVLWDIPMLPADDPNDAGTWSGVGVWGSAPAIDLKRNQVYYATGNVYSVPDRFLPCTADPTHPSCALPARVWQESVLALDMNTGRVKWLRQLGPLDSWTVACTIPPINTNLCFGTPGPDADFGMAPAFVPSGGKGGKDVLLIGQKNGNLFSLAAETGKVEWATATGPGGTGGGLSWGVAVDDSQRVYFSLANSQNKPWRPQPKNETEITGGAHGAASLLTGKLLWETPTPGVNFTAGSPPTVVSDIVIAARQNYASGGALVVLKKATGEILLDMPLDAYALAMVSVFGRYVLFGTGHHAAFDGSFYVLAVPES